MEHTKNIIVCQARTGNCHAVAPALQNAMPEMLPDGTVHTLPDDLRATLAADAAASELWQGLTPLGRNEFICWVEDAKQPATRAPDRADAGGNGRRQTPPLLLGGVHPPDGQGAERVAAGGVGGGEGG